MARRAKGLESVVGPGFRRLGYKNAMNPRDMRAMLDPRGDDAPFSLEQLTKPQRTALDKLDALAPKLFLRPADKKYCEKEIQFVLGLDKQDKIERLRAIVARAFWRADSYAEALAQLLSYRGLTKAATLRKAIDRLNWRSLENPAEKDERIDGITGALAELDLMRRELCSVADYFPVPGAKPDDARFFFVLRLAEVFVIWTGRAPDFDYEEKKRRKKNPEWHEFSTNALTLCGLGVSGLDGLFERLGGKGPRGKAYEALAEYRDLVDGLAQSLGVRAQVIENIIEWEADPPNLENYRKTRFHEPFYGELKARGRTLEEISKLRDAASKNPIGAEARLGQYLGSFRGEFTEHARAAPEEAPMPGLAKHFYSRNRDFCGADLPSSGWLTDFQLVPEPLGYDD